MNTASKFAHEHNGLNHSSQQSDLIRRWSPLNSEQRLLWAILEDGIKSYLANRKCATPSQRAKFAEARSWFEASQAEPPGPFGYETVCDSLGINSRRLLKGLELFDANECPPLRHRPARHGVLCGLAV